VADPDADPDPGQHFVTRVGAALVAPMQALSAAGRHIGKTPGDAALLLLLAFVAVHTREVVAAVWLTIDGDPAMGLQMLVSKLARVASAPLIFLVAGGVGIAIFAGKRRSLGADFDLACVAFVPIVVLEVAVSLVMSALGSPPSMVVMRVAVALGYAWGGVILVLGVLEARSRNIGGES
jgi:hypothetical protein